MYRVMRLKRSVARTREQSSRGREHKGATYVHSPLSTEGHIDASFRGKHPSIYHVTRARVVDA